MDLSQKLNEVLERLTKLEESKKEPEKLAIDEYLSSDEVLKKLKISYSTFKKWFVGKYPTKKIGGKIYIRKETLNEFFTQN
jgi:hypothetical protein